MTKFNTFILMALLSAGCSKLVPIGSTAASLTATKAVHAATVAEEASETPTLTSHQAYLIAREYILIIMKFNEKDLNDVRIRYDAKKGEWRIHVVHEPRRHGGFFTVCVSDKEAKVIRVDGGE